MVMIKNYYLDESGNTGDITLDAPKFTFNEQPFFVLSCLGFNNQELLTQELEKLKIKHKIQAPELKFSSIKKKPNFMADLLDFLDKEKSEILIEAVNKRYAICIQILEYLIIPSETPYDFGEEARFIKKIIADYIYMSVPNYVLASFCLSCNERNYKNAKQSFLTFEAWLKTMPESEIEPPPINESGSGVNLDILWTTLRSSKNGSEEIYDGADYRLFTTGRSDDRAWMHD